MQSLLDATIASRFDLMLIGIGVIGYFFLVSSRNAFVAKDKFYKKVDVASEQSEVAETQPEEEEEKEEQVEELPSVKLGRIIASMERGDHMHIITAELDTFLEMHPEHIFALNEVQAVLHFCGSSLTEKSLPDILFERVQTTEEWDILNAFINFYLKSEQFEKACNVFELNYSTFFDVELDECMEWRLIMAALECGRQPLAEHLLQTSQSNASQKISVIQKWWKRTSAQMCESRVMHMGDVLNRMSNLFNERFPFEDHSDDESTCFLGDDSDYESDADSYVNDMDW